MELLNLENLRRNFYKNCSRKKESIKKYFCLGVAFLEQAVL